MRNAVDAGGERHGCGLLRDVSNVHRRAVANPGGARTPLRCALPGSRCHKLGGPRPVRWHVPTAAPRPLLLLRRQAAGARARARCRTPLPLPITRQTDLGDLPQSHGSLRGIESWPAWPGCLLATGTWRTLSEGSFVYVPPWHRRGGRSSEGWKQECGAEGRLCLTEPPQSSST